MTIRRPDVCADCGAGLEAGTEAFWDPGAKSVRCVSCGALDSGQPAPDHAAAPVPATTETGPVDVAGGSARTEYERRSARELARKQQRVSEDAEWRRSIKEQRPILGRVAVALMPVPEIGPESQSTKAWKIGEEGERRVAEVLSPVSGIEVLHDRLVPRSRTNIDHIVVGPAGVFVIDAKKYTGGIEVRNVGSLFRPDERLYVNNRDCSKLVDGVRGQIDVVRAALGDELADVPISGVLCFVGCTWGFVKRQKVINGVTALWPDALPAHVAAEGELGPRVTAIADHLRSRLRPGS